MNVLDGYGQHDKLIDEPRQVEYSFVLVNRHGITVFAVCVALSNCQTVVGLYGLLHIVKTAVAANCHVAHGMELDFKEAGNLAYRYRHMQFAMFQLRTV